MHRAARFCFSWPRLAAAGMVVGMHAAVLAAVLSGTAAVVPSVEPPLFSVTLIDPAVETAPSGALAERPSSPPAAPDLLAAAGPRSTFHAPAQERRPPPRPRSQARPRSKLQQAAPVAALQATQLAAQQPPGNALAESAPPATRDPDRPRIIRRANYLGAPPSPVYPEMSKRRGEQGRVTLRVLISARGQVTNVIVQRSSGYQRLDEAAIQATRRARFRPYVEDGVARQALVEIPFDFVLQKGLARR